MSQAMQVLRNTPIEDMAKKVFQKEKVTNEELASFYKLDSRITVSQITVSASETRQVKQYESNNYFASMQISFEDANLALKVTLEDQSMTDEQKVAQYLESKKLISRIISERYKVAEEYLRSLIHEQEKGDGIRS